VLLKKTVADIRRRAAEAGRDPHSILIFNLQTVIVGDNLRTDILAGFQAGLETILVLSGVSTLDDIDSMPFRPSWIYPSVAEIDIF